MVRRPSPWPSTMCRAVSMMRSRVSGWRGDVMIGPYCVKALGSSSHAEPDRTDRNRQVNPATDEHRPARTLTPGVDETTRDEPSNDTTTQRQGDRRHEVAPPGEPG